MRRAVTVLCAAIAFAGCNTSTDSGADAAACNSIAAAVCAREYACNSALAGSVSSCETAAEVQCATFSCTNGTSLNSTQVNQCVSDINAEDCTDVGNGVSPTSCNTICQ
jgi:hypothetical protein